MSVENPLKFLLYELPAYIDPEPLAGLIERYNANKKAYAHQCKIAQAERIVKAYQRRRYDGDTAHLTRWEAKLQKLKAEVWY